MQRKNILLFSALLTMFILAVFLFISEKTRVNSPLDLENLKDNSIIITQSKVLESNPYPAYTKLRLYNSLDLLCKKCNVDIIGKQVIIEAVVDEYNNKKTLIVLSYKILND